MLTFSILFLQPSPAWYLRKPLKPMFATLVYLQRVFFNLCVNCFPNNIHKGKWHTQLAYNLHLKVYLNDALILFLIR